MEYACQQSDEPRWFSISVVPLKGPRQGAVITHTDITARKLNEEVTQQLREELAQAGRVMTMRMLSLLGAAFPDGTMAPTIAFVTP